MSEVKFVFARSKKMRDSFVFVARYGQHHSRAYAPVRFLSHLTVEERDQYLRDLKNELELTVLREVVGISTSEETPRDGVDRGVSMTHLSKSLGGD